MPHLIARTTALVALCLTNVLSQTQQHDADSPNYALFLRKVANLQAGPILLNGQDTGIAQPSIQQAMGLTDREVEILRALAVAYIKKVDAIDEALSPIIFEARIRSIDLADPDASRIRQLLSDIDLHRGQLVQEFLDELRVQIGGPRFEVVQVYIRSRKDGNFFSPTGKLDPRVFALKR